MRTKIQNHLPTVDFSLFRGRGVGSVITFLVGAFLLGLSILLGFWLSIGVFQLDNRQLEWNSLFILGVTFLIGLIVSLLSIRVFNNYLLPKIIWGYSWVCAGYAGLVYLRVIQKLSSYDYPFPGRYIDYTFAVFAGLIVVFVMQLVLDTYHVRRFSVPILIGSFIHLMRMLYHYVWVGENFSEPLSSKIAGSVAPGIGRFHYFVGDFSFFLITVLVGVLMLQNAPVLSGIKHRLDVVFRPSGIFQK